jgi:hypothetical protein
MAYYIFLKSLRSLNEFRKNLHVKISPKSPTNFQSLGKFKNPILIRKFLFPNFRPGQPRGPFGLWPSQPTGPLVGRVFAGITFSFSDHTVPSRPPLPRLSVNRAPPVRITPFPTLADPGRKFPCAAAPPRRCPAPRMPPSSYNPPSSLSPLNPLQTER